MPTSFKAPTVQRTELDLRDTGYSAGGFSTGIWRSSGRQGGTLPGLYKEYSEEALSRLNSASLDALICWRLELPTADRKSLDAFCAFPRVIVRNGDRVVGILMDEAPSAFFRQVPGARQRQPRHADELGRPASTDEKPGLFYFPPPHKAALLGVLLERLIWLHSHQVIVSDLHPHNTLVTSDPTMREVYLLDCDSFWLGDLHTFPPHAPEMWRVGDGTTANMGTDLAKFAMLADRAIKQNFTNPKFSDESLQRLLPGQHVRLLRRMWQVDPRLRSEQLGSMARTWTGLVTTRPNGDVILRKWTDAAGYVRWDEHANTAPPQPAGPTQVTPPVSNAAQYATSSRHMPTSARLHTKRNTAIILVATIIVVFLILRFAVW